MYYYIKNDLDNKRCYYIYKHIPNTTLPLRGWIHNCAFCNRQTSIFSKYSYSCSRTLFLTAFFSKIDKLNVRLCVCNYCSNKYELKENKNIDKIIDRILLSKYNK
jgi:hypothetical protein